ncbi:MULTISPECIES: CoA pyrophosphatase [Tenebrionibacter/Tenebrionicola group]|uniref:CoA pyrophosphatase n=1 Tax=Tenebrionibacter intestinalis TaxID=2799638 RepID=A0A8K0XW64_9ENTR|nr:MULTISPECIES: CoA pyrophosphatase [Tenebrionibacter/Tenebrionicola group]MBK4713837.1 CoA pyrophosphatase [Tenebrionibacter intestinalis]MBV4411552.1 CoA pyrophosphatase [Tenebrionicola larvae]
MTLDDFLSRFLLLRPQPRASAANQRQAAVLVPVVRRTRPGLLLTQRSSRLRKHPGQVAFPGGAMDSSDSSLIVAALREAHEEVAIPPACVEVVGILPPVDSISGFRVTPVVGLIPPDIPYRPCEDEVASVFEMPLQEALRLGRYHPLDVKRHNGERRVWLSWYEQYFVWGMTAGIIRELALQTGYRY